jgi:hypothetical protein
MNPKSKWIITMSFIGVAAYMFADIIHEVVGHGGTSLILGIKITLMTSVYFRSNPGNFIASIGGPMSNLFFALLIFVILTQKKNLSLLSRLLLLITMSYNLFWFSGTILDSGFNRMGDWSYAIKKLNIGAFGMPVLVIAGMMAYYFSIKLIRVQLIQFNMHYPGFPLKQSIYYSYFAATLTAIIAGLLFMPDRIHSAFEGLLEMTGSVLILFIMRKEKTEINNYKLKSNLIFNIAIFILFIAFCLTLGRGIT